MRMEERKKDKKVCVIGGGISGLVALKSCLEEGLEVVLFEQTNFFGGVWRYTEDYSPQHGASVYKSLVLNTSKEMTCFSDFPMPPEFPPYVTHAVFMQYLKSYADAFHLEDHIQYNTEVLRVRKDITYQETGKWVVSFKENGITRSEVFGAVSVCSGQYRKAYIPDIPGLDKFAGTCIHTKQYKKMEIFTDKKVLVIGNSNSAGDVATDASHCAKEVYLSIGKERPSLIGRLVPKTFMTDTPIDLNVKRFSNIILPAAIGTKVFDHITNCYLDQESVGFRKENVNGGPMIVNDELKFCILSGQVVIKSAVTEFTEKRILFDDGTYLEDIDVIVFATGFRHSYSFLENDVFNETLENTLLYKWTWPINETHSTLSFHGVIGTAGSRIIAIELQARWAAQVFAGEYHFPSKKIMLEQHKRAVENIYKQYGCFKARVSALEYQDTLAEEIGVKPVFFKILWTDPYLAFKTVFGPAFSVQYRIMGVHKWDGASKAAHRAYSNTKYPLVKNTPQEMNNTQCLVGNVSFLLYLIFIVVLIFCIYLA